jgi:hypothetical protein
MAASVLRLRPKDGIATIGPLLPLDLSEGDLKCQLFSQTSKMQGKPSPSLAFRTKEVFYRQSTKLSNDVCLKE